VDVASLKLPEGYRVRIADENDLEIIDADEPSFQLSAWVKNRTLMFKVVVENLETGERSKHLKGYRLFDAMLAWFAGKFDRLISHWVDGTNLTELNRLTMAGMEVLSAARATWTGKQCLRYQFLPRKIVDQIVFESARRYGLLEIEWTAEISS
jgi:hypothetical protein